MTTPGDNNYLELATPAGDTIRVLRNAHPRARRLRLTVTSVPQVELAEDRVLLSMPKPHNRAALGAARTLLRDFLEVQVRRDVSRYVSRYTEQLGRVPKGVRLKPLKSLWGSLDSRDRVTLDLALALAPLDALRYVVVHELCHLRIRDHSPRFWALVESLYPEWRAQREWLKTSGHALKAELARLIGQGN